MDALLCGNENKCAKCGRDDHNSYACYASRDSSGTQIKHWCYKCNKYHYNSYCDANGCIIV